jgi:hypothetical protein
MVCRVALQKPFSLGCAHGNNGLTTVEKRFHHKHMRQTVQAFPSQTHETDCTSSSPVLLSPIATQSINIIPTFVEVSSPCSEYTGFYLESVQLSQLLHAIILQDPF